MEFSIKFQYVPSIRVWFLHLIMEDATMIYMRVIVKVQGFLAEFCSY